jgi:hypothetical protein
MRKSQVKVGGRYIAKVSGREVVVRLTSESAWGSGWNAVNEETGRAVRVRSAQRLRREAV